jgi:hypothetical protein
MIRDFFESKILKHAFFITAVLAVSFIFSNTDVYALSNSWSNIPAVVSSDTVNDFSMDYCRGIYTREVVANDSIDSRTICQNSGSINSFGTYYEIGYGNAAAINFSGDGLMYRLNNVCTNRDTCIYLEQTDTFVAKYSYMTPWSTGLYVYKNFSKRLTPQKNNIGLVTSYDFDTSNPDYVFKSSGGDLWPVAAINASNNGKWLAVEFYGRGIGVLNMETFQMRQVANMALDYGYGMNPSVEMAVTNDGDAIAVMGANSGFSIFDITNCGNDVSSVENLYYWTLTNYCKRADIDVYSFLYRFANAYHPMFSDDGNNLYFYAYSYTGEKKFVNLARSGTVSKQIDYLAMGDSYSSGEGELNDENYLPGTNTQFEKCHLSIRSYPFLLAEYSGFPDGMFRSVACSGATMDDVVGIDKAYKGQNNRIKDLGTDAIINQAKQEAEVLFVPGRTLQGSFSICSRK